MATTAEKATTFKPVKNGLAGRIAEVLAYCGHDASYADGRHHLCKCGAVKLRISKRETGAGGCDGCGVKWTNLVDMAAHLLSIEGEEARDRLADRFGIAGDSYRGRNHSSTPPTKKQVDFPEAIKDSDGYIRHPQILTSRGWHPEAARRFAESYGNSFSVAALEDAGMELVQWQELSTERMKQWPAIPIYRGESLELVNYTIYRDRGKRLAYGRTPEDKKADIPFDRNGISLSKSARDMLARGEPVKGLKVIKTEGISDFLALLSIIPTDEPYLIWTNNEGAVTTNAKEWLLPMFDRLRPSEHIIIHDRDKAGVEGAAKWASILDRHRMSQADESLDHRVKVVELPLPYSEKKGKDLRDWISQGNGVLEIEKLVDETAVFAPPGKEPIDVSDIETESEQVDTPESEQIKPKEEPKTETVISIRSYGSMIEQYTHLRPERIEGLLRDTELLNIIAAPKIGKSYLVGGMAISIATGRPWMGRTTRQGRVLMVDNELHPELTTDRLRRICRAMQIDDHEIDESIDVLSLRGACCDILQMEKYFALIEKGYYGLIVLDALYRTLPPGSSENDNAAMTAIFNKIDHYAEITGSAFAIVHHSSKGDQSDKSVTDMGSGAGSISRATDTHLVIRPHETEGMAVLEAVTRSFRQVEPISIKWDYPQWLAAAVAPNVRKRKAMKEANQDESDVEADQDLISILSINSERWRTVSEIRKATGWGEVRAGRCIMRALKRDLLETKAETRRKELKDVYRIKLTSGTTSGTTSGS